MSGIYSERLGQAAVPAGTAVDVFTVPAGKVAIVKTLTSSCTGGSGSAGYWLLKGVLIWRYVAAAANATVLDGDVHLVLAAGETLTFTSSAGPWQVSAHGYLLTA